MEQMAAGPPVMASTFSGSGKKEAGDVRSALLPLEETGTEFPHFHGHFFGRTSHEGQEAGKAEHTHTSNETGILLLNMGSGCRSGMCKPLPDVQKI